MSFSFVVGKVSRLVSGAWVTLHWFGSLQIWLMLYLLQDNLYRCVERCELLNRPIFCFPLFVGVAFVLLFNKTEPRSMIWWRINQCCPLKWNFIF